MRCGQSIVFLESAEIICWSAPKRKVGAICRQPLLSNRAMESISENTMRSADAGHGFPLTLGRAGTSDDHVGGACAAALVPTLLPRGLC